jgi:hypothetical protein
MTKTVVTTLYAGVVTLVSGVALIHIPSAVILAGLLLIGVGVLSIDRPVRREEPRA